MQTQASRSSVQPARLLLVFVLAAILWSMIALGSANADKRSVTVMTQNLYQGTEFAHIRVLAQSKEPVSFEEAIAATTADYATYLATRFKDRAKQIAAEVAQNEPALVGLQEVATWHKGAFDPSHPFALPPEVSEDFTKVLVEALEADGMHYQAVSQTARPEGNFTLAFPVAPGPLPYGLTAVGMVERGVILARTDLPPGQLKLSNPRSGTYSCEFCKVSLKNPITGEVIPFTDSWESIDAKVRGKTFRFITTHLDALEPSGIVRYFQAKELLEGPANTTLPVVVAGDMNGGPNTPPTEGLTPYGPAAYGAFLAGGLSDTWTAAGLGAPPLTCCHLAFEDLVNDPNAKYTAGQELDHIFTRGDFTPLDEHLVGNTVPNPAPVPFIWPSDHAGMVATLQIGP
jgi:endonuclease/exonuclease/phosphatase family metal-dependent hydrolase